MHAHYYMHANKKNRNLLRRTARRPRVGPLQTNALESPADAEGTCIYWQLSTLFLSSSNSLASGIQLAAARTPPASTACHLRPGYRSIYAQRQCILSQTECCEHSTSTPIPCTVRCVAVLSIFIHSMITVCMLSLSPPQDCVQLFSAARRS